MISWEASPPTRPAEITHVLGNAPPTQVSSVAHGAQLPRWPPDSNDLLSHDCDPFISECFRCSIGLSKQTNQAGAFSFGHRRKQLLLCRMRPSAGSLLPERLVGILWNFSTIDLFGPSFLQGSQWHLLNWNGQTEGKVYRGVSLAIEGMR